MLNIALQPSKLLQRAILLLHGVAIAALWLAALPDWLRGLATAGLLASAFWYRRQYGTAAPRQVTRLSIDDEGECTISTKDGADYTGRVLGSSLVTPLLSVVRIRAHNRRFTRSVVLLPDVTSDEEYRRLRVHLRWKVRFN